MLPYTFIIQSAPAAHAGYNGLMTDTTPSSSSLPLWRGFNLLEKFIMGRHAAYLEWDFDALAAWGFNFVRLPADYRIWTRAPGQYDEAQLKEIDQAIDWGRQRGIHVNLCLHRAPGYCINPPAEPLNLFGADAGGEEARRQFAAQWGMFAERYRAIPNRELSFDLVNEPDRITPAEYLPAVQAAVEAIRAADPQRLIIADGLGCGNLPVPELVGLGIAQSTRGYQPMQLSHYKASWVKGADRFPRPSWPIPPAEGHVTGRESHWQQQIEPWLRLRELGVGVHVGEWGAYCFTPHPAVLGWMSDMLANWQQAGFGWALWNLRGTFGPLDSNRKDVKYEAYQGHRLDRKMLELLRQF